MISRREERAMDTYDLLFGMQPHNVRRARPLDRPSEAKSRGQRSLALRAAAAGLPTRSRRLRAFSLRTARFRGTHARPACGLPFPRRFLTEDAVDGIRTAASRAPMPYVFLSAVRRLAGSGTGNWRPARSNSSQACRSLTENVSALAARPFSDLRAQSVF